MKSTTEKIEQIKKIGYELDFGVALGQAFENYKKIVWAAGAVILVMGILAFVISVGLPAIYYGASGFSDFMTNAETIENTTSGLILSLISGLLVAILSGPITAGLLQIADNAENNQEFDFATAFEHFKGSTLKEIVLATLMINLPLQLITVGIKQITSHDAAGGMVASLLIIIPVMLISLLTYLTIPLIIFGKLTAVAAIKGSMIVVSKRVWTILCLLIVAAICACFGFIALCIGVIFTAPILYSLTYIIYRTALGMDDYDELDDIGISSELD